MNLRKHSFWLANFLTGWFSDPEDEDESDAAIVARFLAVDDEAEHQQVRRELGALLDAPPPLPWREVCHAANRHFEDEAECRAWLLLLQALLERPQAPPGSSASPASTR